MNEPTTSALEVNAPALPKGGGAIQSIGKGWGAVGTSGAASLELPLPISGAPNRSLVPNLGLGYSSDVGNSPFGIGWRMSSNAITLRTTKGVPRYDGSDLAVGPDGDVWMPERNETDGQPVARTVSEYRGVTVGEHRVVRYHPRVEGAFTLIEHWATNADAAGFWLLHGADGSLHLYGKTLASRRADPNAHERVGVWLLDESLNSRGEHVVYEYLAETEAPVGPQFRDYRAQRYLKRVCYGNEVASADLYSWSTDGWRTVRWHFHLLFDYGERSAELTEKPAYGPPYGLEGDVFGPWKVRSDPFWNYAYGFELGTRRLCRQVLLFHQFPELGQHPVLVQRLLLEHRSDALGYNHLTAAHLQAYDGRGQVENRPPMEYGYNPFALVADRQGYTPFPSMPGLNDGQAYQLVDLYGEGLPGVLYRIDQAWYYREPQRGPDGGDQVRYDEWKLLPHLPAADSSKAVRQSLSDMTGDGKLDWVVAMPGMSGFFTLNPDRTWSQFVPFNAFPTEFFHPQAQLADLVGDGLTDLTLIGSRSVRLYASRREDGFARGVDVPRRDDDDALPLLSPSPTELVAFSDVLGSGQQHLVRIRHNEVKCWPNLGHGRFGKGFVLSTLPFAYEEFEAAQVRLADLDGSGAADLIYLKSDGFEVFMNHAGNGYPDTPQTQPWPEGVRYDRLCEVSFADLQGLGCSSLVLSVPHMSPRHWRYDFVQAKPYLLSRANNNMGARNGVSYRSSAQEWLDEKAQLRAAQQEPVCELPFALHLVSQQTQLDEISGQQLSQHFSYRQGYYDRHEREFRGFGLLLQTDTEGAPAQRLEDGFTAPVLSKTWFHTGRAVDMPPSDGYAGDPGAAALRPTLVQRYHSRDHASEGLDPIDDTLAREVARALSGSVLRSEIYNADAPAVPYGVQQHRYLVRLLRPAGQHQPYAVVQPLTLESRSLHYEQSVADDPLCQHSINLEWDDYGTLTHGWVVYCPRRKTRSDAPPFSDPYQNTWWSDTHDEAQQAWYLTQAKVGFIHQSDPQAWRLGLAYRSRSNALVLAKTDLHANDLCHEKFLELSQDGGPWAQQAVLTGLSLQRYKHPDSGITLPVGAATFEALPDYEEHAELDATALSAYDRVKDIDPNFDLKARLLEPEVGYQPMKLFLPYDQEEDNKTNLWSVRQGFATYAKLEDFYSITHVQQTLSHGITQVTHDPYWCLQTAVQLPDGCVTQVLDIDYRTFLPGRIQDPNENIQEARYNALGEMQVSSFHGTELGLPVGFKPLADYVPPADRSPATAIANPVAAIGEYATAIFSDPFSWMGRISQASPPPEAWRTWARAEGFILPSGHLCDRARQHLLGLQNPSPNEVILQQQLDAAQREPVHVATLQADRYPGDPEAQVRIAIACFDGFARTLQTKQEVEPGLAYVVDENGALKLGADGKPVQQQAARRWRVSERVEYNNKGVTVRVYRPYFADQTRYINDQSFRQHGYCDRLYYDAPGRLVRTVAAKDDLEDRQTYLGWYTIAEDKNDTYEDVMARKAKDAKA